MIPLEVTDRVLGENLQDRVPDVGVAVRQTEIDHLLESRLDREPISGGHHPLRVLPGRVGVQIDHLGLEPQTELHAEFCHFVYEWMQAIRPDFGGHRPVSKTSAIRPPSTEPAVVKDVTFHPDRRCDLRQLHQPVKIVVEVDGLPDVEGDRPLNRGMPLAGSKVAMESGGDGIQTHGVGTIDPWRPIGRALSQDHFAGQEKLSAADDLFAARQSLRIVRVVATPARVQAPDLALFEREARCAQVQHRCGVGSGATLAVLP